VFQLSGFAIYSFLKSVPPLDLLLDYFLDHISLMSVLLQFFLSFNSAGTAARYQRYGGYQLLLVILELSELSMHKVYPLVDTEASVVLDLKDFSKVGEMS